MSKHAISPAVYVIVFVVLLALTLATLIAASLPLGRWHTPIALVIATSKAVLVVLFFMHVLYEGRLTRLVIAGALVWLGILLVLTMTDYVTRSWLT